MTECCILGIFEFGPLTDFHRTSFSFADGALSGMSKFILADSIAHLRIGFPLASSDRAPFWHITSCEALMASNVAPFEGWVSNAAIELAMASYWVSGLTPSSSSIVFRMLSVL